MRTRNHHISVWLDDRELGHLRKQAAVAGLGIDPFIRQLIRGVELRPKPPEEYAELLREMSAIGNNINQLAHQANARGEATQDEINDADWSGLDRASSAGLKVFQGETPKLPPWGGSLLVGVVALNYAERSNPVEKSCLKLRYI